MVPYIILIGYCIMVIVMQDNKLDIRSKYGSVYDFSLLFVFFIFYAIRYNVGFDYMNYVSLIENGWYDGFVENKYEYLSYLFMDIAHAMNNTQLFFGLIAGVSLPLYYYALSRYSENRSSYTWGMLCFLALPIGFMYSLSTSRQFAASAVILYGTKYLLNRKLLKYLLCVSIATLFHTASVIALLGYVVTMARFRMRYLAIVGIACLLVVTTAKTILIDIFPMFETYIKMKYGAASSGMSQIILYVIFAAMFLMIRRKAVDISYYDTYLKLYLLGLILCVAFIPIDPSMGGRIGSFGLIYACFLLPYFLRAFRQENLVKIMVVLAIILIYFYGLSIPEEGAYVPYQIIPL